MNDRSEQPAHGWRHKLPLILGTFAVGLLLVYLVFPGFVIGLLIRTNVVNPTSDANIVVSTVFFVPIYFAKNARPIREFYGWQISVASGYR